MTVVNVTKSNRVAWIVSVLLALFIMATSTGTGAARASESFAQPPEGYPMTDRMLMVNNPKVRLRVIPVHRGYYDASLDGRPEAGFGYDKARHRHGWSDIESIRWILNSDSVQMQGTTAVLVGYSQRFKCSGNTCTEVERVQIKAIAIQDARSEWYGHKFPKPVDALGLQTMYCNYPDGDKRLKCDSWVYEQVYAAARGLPLVPFYADSDEGAGLASGGGESATIEVAGYQPLTEQEVYDSLH